MSSLHLAAPMFRLALGSTPIPLALAGLLISAWPVWAEERPAVPARPAAREPISREVEVAGSRKPSAEVIQAIRWVLSAKDADRKRGAATLRFLGPAIAPELRYWVRDAHERTGRVEAILAQIEGRDVHDAGRQRIVDAFLGERMAAARALARRGEHRAAQRLAEAVLTLEPDGPRAWETRRLVRDCRVRIAASELLEPSFEVARTVYDVGETPVVVFRLRNHMRRTAEIQLDRGVLGQAKVSIQRRSVGGSATRDDTRLVVRASGNPSALTLGPGKEWECEVPLEIGGPMPLEGVVARVVIEGQFRPTHWTAADPNANLTLRVPPVELWIVPPGQLGLGDRPLEKMTVALLFGRDEAFFVGGQLAVWAGEEDTIYNGKVVETLIDHVEELEGERLAVAGRLLAQATGVDLGADAAAWIEWWQEFRDSGGDAPSLEPAN